MTWIKQTLLIAATILEYLWLYQCNCFDYNHPSPPSHLAMSSGIPKLGSESRNIVKFQNGIQNEEIILQHQNGGFLDASVDSLECPTGVGFSLDYHEWQCKWNFVQTKVTEKNVQFTKWRIFGKQIQTHFTNKNDIRCLNFRAPTDVVSDYLEVIVDTCHNLVSQRWFLKTNPGQFEVMQDGSTRQYFSIHSEAFPSKCLTLYNRTIRNKEEEFTRGYMTHPGSFRYLDTRKAIQGFFLDDCTGCNRQSFFIDIPFPSGVKSVIIQGENSFSSLKQESLPTQSECPNNKGWYDYKTLTNNHPQPCHNLCGTYGYNCNWCWVRHQKSRSGMTFKYCSKYLKQNGRKSSSLDYQENRFKENHQCDFHGENYEWCYLEKGSWGYCSTDYDGSKQPILLQ